MTELKLDLTLLPQWDMLKSYRESLMLAGVGALLHNLGKISSKFINKQLGTGDHNYLFQHILGLIQPHCSSVQSFWDQCTNINDSRILNKITEQALKQNNFTLPSPFDDRAYCPGDLIEYLGVSEPWYKEKNGQYYIKNIFNNGSLLTHLMNRSHRGASGGEKEDIATCQQLDPKQLWCSTPFGWEVLAPSDNNIDNIDSLKNDVEKVISHFLTICMIPFSLEQFSLRLRPLLEQAIADTQRPLNDVTVWDIGHVGMAFLVTQAIGMILTKRTISHDELAKKEDRNTLFWRVLEFRTNGIGYLEEASSIADLRVRYNLLNKALDRVKEYIQYWGIAYEIYRDENGSFYVFPDIGEDNEVYKTLINALANHLEIDGQQLTPCLSNKLVNHPKDEKSDSEYIGTYILKKISKGIKPLYKLKTYKEAWSSSITSTTDHCNKEICVSCGIRPQGYGASEVDGYQKNPAYYSQKAENRNLCCLCLDRRRGVAERWVKKELENTTVWIDEVSDNYGRVALIASGWSLEDFAKTIGYPGDEYVFHHWEIEVEFLDTKPGYNIKTFEISNEQFWWNDSEGILINNSAGNSKEIKKKLKKVEEKKFKMKRCDISNLDKSKKLKITIQDVELSNNTFLITVEDDLSTFKGCNQVKLFGKNFSIDPDKKILKTMDDDAYNKVKELILWDFQYPFKIMNVNQITYLKSAQSQSFARIRRVWETTRKFWQDVLPTDKDADKLQSVIATTIGTAGPRLKILGNLQPQKRNDKPGDYHVYDLVLSKGVKLSVLWDTGNKCFITCDNLSYVEQLLSENIHSALQSTLKIEEPAGYGSRIKQWGTITISNIEIMEERYVPAIPILAEPRTFMALVPADRAVDVAEAIRQKYEREMGKVRNRLPLHLGLVYFNRRTPLRAALDAGRRMLTIKNKARVLAGENTWHVTEKPQKYDTPPAAAPYLSGCTQQFNTRYAVQLKNENKTLTWRVPAVMGDGSTIDNWYPYVFGKKHNSDSEPFENRERVFKGLRPTKENTEECWLVHAGDLEKDDEVYFTPSTFDFEFLDTNSRRFEIIYDQKARRLSQKRKSRPYLLDELTSLNKAWHVLGGKNGLTVSQIHALRDLIEIKRDEWQPDEKDCEEPHGLFWQFCRSTLSTLEWPKSMTADKEKFKEILNKLTRWAVSGLLTDCIELRMGIMKEKPERQKDKEEVSN